MAGLEPTGPCARCLYPVLLARTAGGGSIALERCAQGGGNIAVSLPLFADGRPPLAELVSNGTSYRAHREHCPGAAALSFSSASSGKKKRA